MRHMAPLLLLGLLFPLAGAEEDTEDYVFVNPWSSAYPDCAIAPAGLSLGLGGGCFDIPAGASHFRAALEDDVWGPGYGHLMICSRPSPSLEECAGTPICRDSVEGMIPPGAIEFRISTFDSMGALTFCGIEAASWVPTHGTISIQWT